jgi:hypothetical protein
MSEWVRFEPDARYMEKVVSSTITLYAYDTGAYYVEDSTLDIGRDPPAGQGKTVGLESAKLCAEFACMQYTAKPVKIELQLTNSLNEGILIERERIRGVVRQLLDMYKCQFYPTREPLEWLLRNALDG